MKKRTVYFVVAAQVELEESNGNTKTIARDIYDKLNGRSVVLPHINTKTTVVKSSIVDVAAEQPVLPI